MNMEDFLNKVRVVIFDLEPNASSSIIKFIWKRNITKTEKSGEIIETPEKEGTLEITFKTNNKCYQYKNVPLAMFEKFVCSESYGKFFCKNILNKYEVIKEQ